MKNRKRYNNFSDCELQSTSGPCNHFSGSQPVAQSTINRESVAFNNKDLFIVHDTSPMAFCPCTLLPESKSME